MAHINSYSSNDQNKALNAMSSELLTKSDIRAICKARGFPKEAIDNMDLFQHYLGSEEGLEKVLQSITQAEQTLLLLLHVNSWVVDVSFFEAAYKPLPKQDNWYHISTFTQKYKEVLKELKQNLVRKGILLFYQERDYGNTVQLERWRFLLPQSNSHLLPWPIKTSVQTAGKWMHNEEKVRLLFQDLKVKNVEVQSPNSSVYLSEKNKLMKGKNLLNDQLISEIRLEEWERKNILPLQQKFKNKGKKLTEFLLHIVRMMPDDTCFSSEGLRPLVKVWNYDRDKDAIRYQETAIKKEKIEVALDRICEIGWQCGIFDKSVSAGKAFYKRANPAQQERNPAQFFEISEDGGIRVDFSTLPLEWVGTLNFVSRWEPEGDKVQLIPDKTYLGRMNLQQLAHPLIKWLKADVAAYKHVFDAFQKAYGKQIIHQNLMIAKISDLSLKVSIEKALAKKNAFVSLSNEYIAFPKEMLNEVEKLVIKSGNVIKFQQAVNQK